MSDPEIYPVPAELAARAHMDRAGYEAARMQARETPEAFWAEQAERLDWMTFPTKIKDVSFNKADFRIRWFEDGVLNASVNCIDRHLPHRADDVAIIWEGDEPTDSERVTYGQLHDRVCRMANVLKANGVRKGDRVTIYLPMIPEAAYAMLACARIGAVHVSAGGQVGGDGIDFRISGHAFPPVSIFFLVRSRIWRTGSDGSCRRPVPTPACGQRTSVRPRHQTP